MQDNDEPRSFAKAGALLLPIIGTLLNIPTGLAR